MDNSSRSKKVTWVIVILVVVAILAIIGIALSKSKQNSQEEKPAEFKVQQTDVSNDQLPEKFPGDIPLETGAKVTQNYNATTTDGRFQATRTFESKKTLDDNMKIYTDYAKKAGWTLGTAIDQPKLKVVSANKGNMNLVVTINQSSGITTVNITVTQQVSH